MRSRIPSRAVDGIHDVRLGEDDYRPGAIYMAQQPGAKTSSFKAEASRDSRPEAEAEVMILKARMVVKPMASTAEAQEESIRFIRNKMTLEEAKGSKSEELEIQGQRRKPPYLYRRSCRHSRPWPEERWYKESDNVKFSSVEERDLAYVNLMRSLTGNMNWTLDDLDGDAKAPAATELEPQI